MNPIDRRSFLRAGGIAFAGLVAAACSKKTALPDPGGSAGSATGPTGTTTIGQLTKGKQTTMNIAVAQTNLPRQNDRLVLALLHVNENKVFSGGTARAWVAPDQTTPAQGPIPLVFHGEGLGDKGVYVGRANFEVAGNWIVYAEATPEGVTGTLSGGAALPIGRQTQQPIPGEKAISVPTPLASDHRGVEPYCTLKPKPCTMHQISLDVALKNGKPTVLLIGTPQFCQSRTCGPVTEVVQTVSNTDLGPKLNFIHIEEFKDDKDAPAKLQLSPAAAAWKLDEEPAVYYIKPDGTIVEWSVGPTDVTEVTSLAKTLLA